MLADDGQRTFVDLNQIPLEAVERIEVLKDGASSIYGSDAVAGVVNIILRKNFVGTALKASYGLSQEGDGNEAARRGHDRLRRPRQGRLQRPPELRSRARRTRSSTATAPAAERSACRPSASRSTASIRTRRPSNTARVGGNGWIPTSPLPTGRTNNATSPSIVGNVRNPTTLDYYSRVGPGGRRLHAAPSRARRPSATANTNLPQNNPAGGCINDARQAINQIQPEQETANFFGRLTKAITPTMEGFIEFGYYHVQDVGRRACRSRRAPATSGPNGDVVFATRGHAARREPPGQPVPRHGRPAVAICPLFDTGIAADQLEERFVPRSSPASREHCDAWDYDTGVVYSEARQTDTSTKTLNWRVKNALLNPTAANVAAATAFSPAYAALPAGTFWRIGENAGLNSPAMYDALLADQERNGYSQACTAPTSRSRQ